MKKETRYSFSEAQEEAQKIQEIVGDNASVEDINEAVKLLEEENLIEKSSEKKLEVNDVFFDISTELNAFEQEILQSVAQGSRNINNENVSETLNSFKEIVHESMAELEQWWNQEITQGLLDEEMKTVVLLGKLREQLNEKNEKMDKAKLYAKWKFSSIVGKRLMQEIDQANFIALGRDANPYFFRFSIPCLEISVSCKQQNYSFEPHNSRSSGDGMVGSSSLKKASVIVMHAKHRSKVQNEPDKELVTDGEFTLEQIREQIGGTIEDVQIACLEKQAPEKASDTIASPERIEIGSIIKGRIKDGNLFITAPGSLRDFDVWYDPDGTEHHGQPNVEPTTIEVEINEYENSAYNVRKVLYPRKERDNWDGEWDIKVGEGFHKQAGNFRTYTILDPEGDKQVLDERLESNPEQAEYARTARELNGFISLNPSQNSQKIWGVQKDDGKWYPMVGELGDLDVLRGYKSTHLSKGVDSFNDLVDLFEAEWDYTSARERAIINSIF